VIKEFEEKSSQPGGKPKEAEKAAEPVGKEEL